MAKKADQLKKCETIEEILAVIQSLSDEERNEAAIMQETDRVVRATMK